MASKKKILVIGSGFAGIASIKSLKEEGYEPICYEKTSNAGGTWYYREDSPVGIASIMPTTTINSSKEIGALTNFIPDKRLPNYMRHHQFLRFFTDIGEHFDCFRHIIYNREVMNVTRSGDHNATGRWDVTVMDTETGGISEDTFDSVFVCAGQFNYPKMPEYPGMEKFEGTIMHTHSLKGVDMFRKKNVLVVGMGCSGLDAAVEISSVSSQVYLSSRNGNWIVPRVGPYGLPFDHSIITRFSFAVQNLVGYKIVSLVLENYHLNSRFNHTLYNLRPAYHALSRDPAINDLLPSKLLSGSVAIRKNVKCFTEKGVIFEGETEVTEVDAVIMATGYTWQFPFLEEGIITTEDGRIDLYKCVYPLHLKHPTLPIIGFLLPWGPAIPLAEMQCRWAAQLLSGHCKLPSEEDMIKDTKERHEANSLRYAPSERMTVRVDNIHYMDELALEFGAKPNMWKMFFTDFQLFWALAFGPFLPYQYRLQGPHQWDGARNAIFTAHERVCYPLLGGMDGNTKLPFAISYYLRYTVAFLLISILLTLSETSVKCYLVALVFPFLMAQKRFHDRLFFSLLMLPFFVTWQGFIESCTTSLFAFLFLLVMTSF